MKPRKDKELPCFFIQTGVGNIVIRLGKSDADAGSPLTLPQIISMEVPVAAIPNFDPGAFKQFYGTDNLGKTAMYKRIVGHQSKEETYLKVRGGDESMNEERRFLVTWSMDIRAKTPRAAAIEALIIHRDPESLATAFEVVEIHSDLGIGPTILVDLDPNANGVDPTELSNEESYD